MGVSGRSIAHRLYLSALTVLVVLGVAFVVTAFVTRIHDDRVTEEDRRCFVKMNSKSKPFDPDAFLQDKPARRRVSEKEARRLGFTEEVDEEMGVGLALVQAAERRCHWVVVAASSNRGFTDDELDPLPAKAKGLTDDGFVPDDDGFIPDDEEDPSFVEDKPDLPPLPPGATLDPEGYSARAWLGQSLTLRDSALTLLALLPAAVFWVLGRWLRWLFKPEAA